MKHFKRTFIWLLCIAMLIAAVPASASAADRQGAWDGKTIDVSWYSTSGTTFYISTPAQLMGLAAIVNGIYNTDITSVTGDASCIKDATGEGQEGGNGNNKSTATFHYGADSFKGKTVYLTADLDMGGTYDPATETWSGPNYMPIGGQYLMTPNDASTKISASFCGTFDGQGHSIYNIYCSRRCTTGNFGDGQSVGLIGRLGVHDSDDEALRPTDPAVRNVAVSGYIYANRSVGGIVGKIGKTSLNSGDGSTGGIIENCANYATVANTDAKGCGGIVGAAWNGGIVRNCYNAGRVMSSYACPTAGIAGSNEITLQNCYNVGNITASKDSYAMAIGTNNGGAPYTQCVLNCWYLDGSATGGGYFGTTAENSGAMTAGRMKTTEFAATLGSAFTADTALINGGYPILKWQAGSAAYGDTDSSAWYSQYVTYVTEKGYFDATTARVFSPEAPMTRAMLVTALWRMAGSPDTELTTKFGDVPSYTDYAEAVAWAYGAGVVNGTTDTTFEPRASITREQIVTMFDRYAEKVAKANMTVSDSLAAFSDAGQVSSYASAGMKWAVAAGLINGTTSSTISPQGTATRAQVAAMVERLAVFAQ